MRFLELQSKIKTNIFTFNDVLKHFNEENSITLKNQISRFAKKGFITRIKRGLYCFNMTSVDELGLAKILYQPSYISLESALNYYGIIPDIPQSVTSVTSIKPTKIKTILGIYHYFKIKPQLFFGYDIIQQKNEHIKIAKKEKALLDFFYLRKIKKVDDLRLNLKLIDKQVYQKYLKNYPSWLREIKI